MPAATLVGIDRCPTVILWFVCGLPKSTHYEYYTASDGSYSIIVNRMEVIGYMQRSGMHYKLMPVDEHQVKVSPDKL